MDQYKFCSYNVKQSIYRVFTCPQDSCPENPKAMQVTHTSFESKQSLKSEWGFFETANNWRMQFQGDPKLNGKIKIQLDSKGAYVYIYMMPNRFNKEVSNTIGILENNKIIENKDYSSKSAIFEVPTDWTIYITYNVGYLDGYVSVRSWAEEYTLADKSKIANEWMPTGTSKRSSACGLKKAMSRLRSAPRSWNRSKVH